LSQSADSALPDRRERRRVFWVLAAAASLTILDVSKLGVALPAIQGAMGGDPAVVQLMLVGYTLAYAAVLVPAGRIGDVVSRRRVFLIGTGVFVAASVTCAISPTIELLVAARIIEGVGAGLLMPQVLGLVQRIFPAEERARPLAALAALTTITSLAAPVMAGLILDIAGGAQGWRLLFMVTVVVGTVVFAVAVAVVKDPLPPRQRGFDGWGTVLLAAGVVLTIAPFSVANGRLPTSPWAYGASVAGIGLLIIFAAHERRLQRRGAEPLIDLTLFRLPHFRPGVVASGFMHAAATAGTLIVTIALQQIARLTPLETALWMLPSAVASVMGTWVASRVSATSGSVIAIGAAIGAFALAGLGFVFGFVPSPALPWAIAALLCASSFGAGVAAPANQARTLVFTPSHRSSVAGSLIQFAQRTGSAVGMASALIIYYAFFAIPTSGGQPASGPMYALWAVAAMLAVAAIIAVVDHLHGHTEPALNRGATSSEHDLVAR
jgi:Arabinose efflux permease